MKNVRESQLKKAIFMLSDEFEELLSGFGLKAEFAWDGLSIYDPNGKDDYDDEAVNKMLSDHFGVTVTSVHTDDSDLVGVWIVYKEP